MYPFRFYFNCLFACPFCLPLPCSSGIHHQRLLQPPLLASHDRHAADLNSTSISMLAAHLLELSTLATCPHPSSGSLPAAAAVAAAFSKPLSSPGVAPPARRRGAASGGPSPAADSPVPHSSPPPSSTPSPTPSDCSSGTNATGGNSTATTVSSVHTPEQRPETASPRRFTRAAGSSTSALRQLTRDEAESAVASALPSRVAAAALLASAIVHRRHSQQLLSRLALDARCAPRDLVSLAQALKALSASIAGKEVPVGMVVRFRSLCSKLQQKQKAEAYY